MLVLFYLEYSEKDISIYETLVCVKIRELINSSKKLVLNRIL